MTFETTFPRQFQVSVLHSDGSASYATGEGKLNDELTSNGEYAAVFPDIEQAKEVYATLCILGFDASIETIRRAA